MIQAIVTLLSHMLFIYISHQLLLTVPAWHKWFRPQAEGQGRKRLLILFLAIGLGYMVSTFFLDILSISRELGHMLIP